MNGYIDEQSSLDDELHGDEKILEKHMGQEFDDVMKHYLFDDVVMPRYDMSREKFNYISETHLTEEVLKQYENLEENEGVAKDKIIGKRKDRVINPNKLNDDEFVQYDETQIN